VAREVARLLSRFTLIVDKSTVPVHTGEKVKQVLRLHGKPDADFDVVSNPEFLREGTAVKDFLHPDRVVVGVESKRAERAMRELYAPLKGPLIVTDIKSAELIKHSSNSFLAMKISFINAVSGICERVGADVTKVAEGMGHDPRIGKSFLKAGLGFGGSCFPKDLSAYVKMAEEAGYDFELLKAVQKINSEQRRWVLKRLKKALWTLRGKTVAVWGLAFKPDTDDLRNAPALDIVAELQAEGCHVRVHDPVAMSLAKPKLKGAYFARNAYDAAKGADAVVLATEWGEYKDLDMKKVRALLHTPVFLDGRNLFDPAGLTALGFQVHAVGRTPV
jgi:UDPglucose 6-dehydrogenase